MDERQNKGLADIEDAAVGVIRRARRACEQLGGIGLRYMGVADWLEAQVPRVGDGCRALLHAVVDELAARPTDRN